VDPLRELAEREALVRLKGQYFYYLDTKQWDAWLGLFTEDASLAWDRAPGGSGRNPRTVQFEGIDAIADTVVGKVLADAVTVHHGHTPLLDLLSDDDARGIWAMEDVVISAGGTTHGFGHYHETYRRMDGAWRITTLHLTRLLLSTTAG
jgi:hypothetical protein